MTDRREIEDRSLEDLLKQALAVGQLGKKVTKQ